MTDSTIHAGGQHLSGAALAARGVQVAAGLAAMGVREGDVIAVLLRNGLPYLEIIQACKRLGCYYCPINWHFTAAEAAFLIEDSGARLLIAHADLWLPLRDALPASLPVLLAGPGASQSGPADYDAWRDRQQPYDGPRVAPRGHMAYTSGTTGRPKGVVRAPFPLEHLARHLEQVEAVVEAAYGLRPGSRALLPAPIYHSAPSVFAQVALRVCETFVLTDRFDPVEVLRLIEAHRIDTVYLVPIMYVRLLRLDAATRAAHDLSSLRFVASTGAPCAPEIKRAMIEWLGPVIHETYASSEAGMVTVIDSHEALARPGSAGRPIGGAQVRIYAEDGSPCAAGQVGRIHVRQPAYADFTYRNNPQARADVEKDGLIGLGDLGYLDADGYLYVCDRESDLVISGGVNIYPAEVEHQLMQYPGVADCAVFGVPDDEYGERLMALVQPAAGASPDPGTLTQWLGERIARYKVPRELQLRSELPRDDNGKIAKRRLRAEFWAGRQRQV
ncbi:AMP-binding protein [Achromobacter xylosoxidans]|uniref:Long-chain fatty acid--CoA ligase n=1 Tax=Alcaligenes xylosoxydans xylosoxydans TaxID=85698 RepID=A0A424WEW4_ALCXX|nr:AMP-binding protein [Achromobacter xylosoxidans]MBC9904549.1 AMP-binding protein [Achromobacter xylosoxidans]MBD0869494.1 AMP-binding protein [Achromobacter xylosoxidans]QNP87969.1 AMP-binding protein [Achromobacter xylosoxidans]RPJ91794.1 long-chain fatty acid--CoA ligase [Achromobacter xylosoxidans]